MARWNTGPFRSYTASPYKAQYRQDLQSEPVIVQVGRRLALGEQFPLDHAVPVLDGRSLGIDEAALAGEVETAIRDALLRMMLSGAWRVAVSPSPVSGRWDLSISGPGRRHVMAITVPSRLLPSLIPSRLEESLNHAYDT